MDFTIYNLPPLISSILFFLFGLFVFLKNKKSALNTAFLSVCLVTFWWQFSWFILFSFHSRAVADYLVKIGYLGIIFIPITFFHFSLLLPENKKKINIFIKYFAYFIGLIFSACLFFTNYLVNGFYDYFWGFYPRAGFLHPFFLLFLSSLTVRIFYLSFQKLKESKNISPHKYYQLKYVLWAIVFYVLAASDFIVNYGVEFYPFGFVFIIIFLGIFTYAIIRYRLMDIRIVARKIFIYLGVAGFAYGIFYAIILLYNRVFGSVFSSAAYVSGIIVAPLFVLTFYALDKGLKHFANKYLFVSLYNYQETINNLTDELNHYIEIDKIIGLIVETIKKTMQLDRAGVLIADLKTSPVQYRIAKIIGFNEQNGISLVQDSFLTKHLQKIQKPLVRDEFLLLSRDSQDPKERESFAKLFEHMEHIEASICLPLMSSDKLIGIIVLGAKISGDAYTKEDLDLLNTLSKQAGIAVDNALLYGEVKDFNASLKTEVAKATAEIQVGKAKVESALVVEKEAREELQKLNQAKTEFLNLASHQLRTPTSVIKGIASMIKEGSFEKFPKEKQATFIEGLYDKALKLEDIINDILNASEMTSTKFKVTPEHANWVDPESFIKELASGFEPKLAERQIDLKISIENSPLPKILCQQEFLKDAIGNLIENAIKYTPSAKADSYTRNIREGKAEINVSVFQQDNSVVFKIQDNGIGIPKEEISNIFKKFQRGSNARDMYTDGSGLGLFIVKEIIEGHGGQVWAESEIGKGSSFFASLPTNPPKDINIKATIIERAGGEVKKTNA